MKLDSEQNVIDSIEKGQAKGEGVLATLMFRLLENVSGPLLTAVQAIAATSAFGVVTSAVSSSISDLFGNDRGNPFGGSGKAAGLATFVGQNVPTMTTTTAAGLATSVGQNVPTMATTTAAGLATSVGQNAPAMTTAPAAVSRLGSVSKNVPAMTTATTTISQLGSKVLSFGNVAYKSIASVSKLAFGLTKAIPVFGQVAAIVGGVMLVAMNDTANAARNFGVSMDQVTLGMRGSSTAAGVLTGTLNFITFGLFDQYLGTTGVITKGIAKFFAAINSFTGVFTLFDVAVQTVKMPLQLMYGAFKGLGKLLSWALEPLTAMTDATQKIGNSTSYATQAFSTIASGIKQAGEMAAHLLTPAFAMLRIGSTQVAGSLALLNGGLRLIGAVFGGVFKVINAAVDVVMRPIQAMYESVSGMFGGMSAGMTVFGKVTATFTEAATEIDAFFSSIASKIKSATLPISPLVSVMANVLRPTIERITVLMYSAQMAYMAFAKGIKIGITTVIDALRPAIKSIESSVGTMWDAISSIFPEAEKGGKKIDGVVTALGKMKWAFSLIMDVGILLTQSVLRPIADAISFFSGLLAGLTPVVQDISKEMGPPVKELFAQFGELGRSLGSIGSVFGEIYKPIREMLGALNVGGKDMSTTADAAFQLGKSISFVLKFIIGPLKGLAILAKGAAVQVKMLVAAIDAVVGAARSVLKVRDYVNDAIRGSFVSVVNAIKTGMRQTGAKGVALVKRTIENLISSAVSAVTEQTGAMVKRFRPITELIDRITNAIVSFGNSIQELLKKVPSWATPASSAEAKKEQTVEIAGAGLGRRMSPTNSATTYDASNKAVTRALRQREDAGSDTKLNPPAVKMPEVRVPVQTVQTAQAASDEQIIFNEPEPIIEVQPVPVVHPPTPQVNVYGHGQDIPELDISESVEQQSMTNELLKKMLELLRGGSTDAGGGNGQRGSNPTVTSTLTARRRAPRPMRNALSSLDQLLEG